MIRPIKIFLYFVLTVSLIILINKMLDKADVSLIPTPGMFTEDSPDTLITLEISPEEQIEPSDSIPAEDTIDKETLVPPDTLSRQKPGKTDSVLNAPPTFRELYQGFIQRAQKSGQKNPPVRVLHIGDSQIEADRITSILRSHFQQSYGGKGPGLIMPYDPLRINATVRLTNQGKWDMAYSYRNHEYPGPAAFGFQGKAAWFRDEEAGFNIAPRSGKKNRLNDFTKVRLLTTSPVGPFRLNVSANGSILSDTTLSKSDSLKINHFELPAPPSDMSFRFSGTTSPLIHGLTLDGKEGIAVDNIAMRGRPWPGFRLAGDNIIKSTARHLNIGFIILQFGTNILPTQTDDYGFYRVHFYRELKRIRELLPEVPILVIGVQASATLQEGDVVPMTHASLISAAQKSAVLAFDMGFFDLHKAMGGKEGAIHWADEGLMLTDYMHFSARGARKTGDRIWTALQSLHQHPPQNTESN
ncbi:MAG: hypothetical protein ACOC30_00880 [Marinilabilia sp.]